MSSEASGAAAPSGSAFSCRAGVSPALERLTRAGFRLGESYGLESRPRTVHKSKSKLLLVLPGQVFKELGVGGVFADEEEEALDGFDRFVAGEAAADDAYLVEVFL